MIKVSKETSGSLDSTRAGITGIEHALRTLEGRLALLEHQWDGNARLAFSAASARWREQLRILTLLASQANSFAQQHIDAVEMFDKRRASAWRR